MTTPDPIDVLAAVNPLSPVHVAALEDSAARDSIRASIEQQRTKISVLRPSRRRARRSVVLAGAGLAVATFLAVFSTVGSPGRGPGVVDASAAVRKAATLTAASAEQSGRAVVRITQNGDLWAGNTIRWKDDDLAVSSDVGRPSGRAGSELRVVDGRLYAVDPVDGAWVQQGTPANIDPDSGTTPAEYLAAVREDVGGVTLRRITDGMTGLTTRQLEDGSTVYRGLVAARLIARETGFKEGQPIRVLPFGYVAHDEAADPAAPLDVAVTVGPDGIVRKLVVTWGSSPSAWTYAVTYSGLGSTAAPVAPAHARNLLEDRLRAVR